MTAELQRTMEDQRERTRKAQEKEGRIISQVFWYKRGSIRPIGDIRKRWDTACTAAGLAGRIPHDFRRTAVRNLVRAGIPEAVAMKMTGHKTREVFERYNIVSKRDLSDARDALDRMADKHIRKHNRESE